MNEMYIGRRGKCKKKEDRMTVAIEATKKEREKGEKK